MADGDSRVALAATNYARALDGAPDNPLVAVRAYREALQAGDLRLADRAAASLARAGALPDDAALLALAAAARDDDTAAVDAALTRLDAGRLKVLVPALKTWRGAATPAPAPADIVSRRFQAEARALMALGRGDIADGLAQLRALLGNDQASQDNRLAAARLLIARGQPAEASALLAGDAPAIASLRARVEDRDAGARATLAFGVSHLLTRVADDIALGEPGPLTYALLQSALRADPGNDRARLLLAGALMKEGATERSLEVLKGIDPRGIHAASAATARVQVLAAGGLEREALALAVAQSRAEDADPADLSRLGALYLQQDEPAKAVPLLRRVAEAPAADWSDWLQLGAALDEAGRWEEAKTALRRAQALAPANAAVLNYLGYGMIEHRERMGEAQALLERASRLEPQDPAITDSLGWALLVRGRTAQALPLLERAAAGAPDNSEIAEHLGDAYWRVGRRYEARYAWTAARGLADPATAERLAGKIADGL